MPWLEPTTLCSAIVNLVPLELRHREELIEAVEDGDLFKLWYTSIPAPETMRSVIEQRLEQQTAGAILPFAIIDNAIEGRGRDQLFEC